MSIAILATGDELIWGDTLNTNTQKMAHILHSEHQNLGYHLTVGDELNDIINALQFLAQKHQTIIITGGLGPTSDDRTRFALAQWLQVPLIEFKEALDHISERLKRANIAVSEGNRQQCLFPKNATLLSNPNGTAMGCQVSHNNITYFLLPGPPKECLPMFNDFVLPHLASATKDDEIILKWLLFGVAESQIAAQLELALQDMPCTLGYRLDWPYVEFKVKTNRQHIEKIESLVAPIAEPHLLFRHQKASFLLKERLKDYKERIEVIDDVTGGHLQTTLQSPETKAHLIFHESDEPQVSFKFSGLLAYWNQEMGTYETQVQVSYAQNGIYHEESAILPYRGTALVLLIATEWLCFCMLKIINQTHKVVA